MTRIPVDPAAPIACAAGRTELSARIEQVEHLRERLRRIERTDTGLLLHFDADVALAAHLQRFVLDEKGCCQFWGFEIADHDGDLTLAWDGPPEVQTILDELDRYFRSDVPLTALAGLL